MAGAALALLAVTACSPGQSLGGPGGRRGTSSSSPGLDVVGTWRNVIAVITDEGDIQSTETTWTFGQSGGCRRLVTLRSVTFGLVDELGRDCTYSASATSVTVRFVDDSLAVTFAAVVRGDTLLLDDFAFLRVAA